MIVANATGCSSIYGANLPTTPWTVNAAGRGPAWSNSLFEDNAEFGLGMRLALDAQTDQARRLLERLAPELGDGPRRASSSTPTQDTEAEIVAPARAGRPAARRARPDRRATPRPTPGTCSRSPATSSARASGSSAATAGPTTSASAASTRSCRRAATSTSWSSTPRSTRTPAARPRRRRRAAPWPSSRPPARAPAKKDLGAIARSYGNVYVAQVSMGANDLQTTKALLEADAWPGPSLVIAYSTCIAHGIDMSQVDDPPEGRGQERLLAALPVPPVRDRGRQAVQARLRRRRRSRSPTSWRPRRASPSSSARTRSGPPSSRRSPRPTPTSAGATTNSSPASNAPSPTSIDPTPRSLPEVESDAGYRYDERGGRGMTRRPAHPLPRSGAALADRRLGRAAERGAGHGPAPRGARASGRSSCRRCSRRRSSPRRSSSTARSSRAPSTSPRRSTTSRRSIGSSARPTATSPSLERVKAAVAVPVIASLNASSAGGWVRYARRIQDAGADALELNLYHVAADPRPDGRRHGGAPTSSSSRPSAPRSRSRSPSS